MPYDVISMFTSLVLALPCIVAVLSCFKFEIIILSKMKLVALLNLCYFALCV